MLPALLEFVKLAKLILPRVRSGCNSAFAECHSREHLDSMLQDGGLYVRANYFKRTNDSIDDCSVAISASIVESLDR